MSEQGSKRAAELAEVARKYANPILPGSRVYAPARGVRLNGAIHLGGESMPLDALQQAGSKGLQALRELGAHFNEDRAYEDFLSRPVPGKEQGNIPAVGDTATGWEDEQIPVPEVPGSVWNQGRRERADRPTVAEGRARLGEAGQYVTPYEAARMTPSSAASFADYWNRSGGSRQLAVAAKLGESKRGWYEDAARSLDTIFGDDAPRFASLLAATSPRKSVAANLSNALHLWEAYQARRKHLGRELTQDEVRDLFQGARQTSPEPMLPNEANNVVRALVKPGAGRPGHLSGPKVGSFGPNMLTGGEQEVTNDTWQSLLLGLSQDELKGFQELPDEAGVLSVPGGSYAAASAKHRKAAQSLSTPQDRWSPAEVQETGWSLARSLSHAIGRPRFHERGTNPREAASRIMDPIQALEALTHEDVAGNVDFSSLLGEDRSHRDLLKRLGLEGDLDRAMLGTEQARSHRPRKRGPVLGNIRPEDRAVADHLARELGRSIHSWLNPRARLAKKVHDRGPRVASHHRYATEERPYRALPQFNVAGMTTSERQFLEGLVAGDDPDVSAMATEVLKDGDPAAILMLHDALLDAGYPDDGQEVSDLLDMIGFAASEENMPGTSKRLPQAQAAYETRLAAYEASNLEGGGGPSSWYAHRPAVRDANRQVRDDMIRDASRPSKRALSRRRKYAADPFDPATIHSWLRSRARLSREAARGPLSRVRYATEERPYRALPRFNTSAMTIPERQFLNGLVAGADPDVAAMAAEVLESGDHAALLMLHDALLDAGYADDSDEISDLLDMIGFAASSSDIVHEDGRSERSPKAQSYADVRDLGYREGQAQATTWNAHTAPMREANRQVRDDMIRDASRPSKRSLSRRRYAADPFDPATEPEGMVAASENKESDLTFTKALQQAQGQGQKEFRRATDEMVSQMGLRGKSHNAVGDWEDGAEHSIVNFIHDKTGMDTLRYLGAWYGLMGNQRAVLVFDPQSAGQDSVYDLQVPDTDLEKVRKQLSQAGVPFRTLVPGKNGTRVVVYDQARKLRDKVAQFAGAYGARISETIGSGEFVGGSSRAAARRTYRDIIGRYEATHGRGLSPGEASGHDRSGGAAQAA